MASLNKKVLKRRQKSETMENSVSQVFKKRVSIERMFSARINVD